MSKSVFSAPLSVCWDLTYRCNLKCIHCCFSSYNCVTNICNEKVPIERMYDVLDELDKMKIIRLEIAGGEPLLYPQFDSFIKYVQTKHFEISVVTNGLLLSQEKLNMLKKCRLTQIQISLDGFTPYIHEFIRGKGTFGKTIEKIRMVLHDNINLVVAAMVYKENYNRMDEFVEFLYRLKVRYFRIQFLLPIGEAKSNFEQLFITEEEQDFAIKTVLSNEHVKAGEIRVILPCFYNKKENGQKIVTESKRFYSNTCGAGTMHVNINPYGDVSACTMLTGAEWIEGNIINENFADIWKCESRFKKWRNEYSIEGGCKDCSFINECRKGCKALTFTVKEKDDLIANAKCIRTVKGEEKNDSISV